MDTEKEKRLVPPPHSARHKLATATDLAAYWDSDADLMCIRAEERRRRGKRRRPWEDARGVQSGGGRSRGSGDTNASTSDGRRHYSAMFASLTASGGTSASQGNFAALEGFVPLPHTYVLQPMSASLHLTMVSPGIASDANENDGDASLESSHETDGLAPPERGPLPPSRAVLVVPSCHVTLARSTLEDIAYVRHSVSVLQQINSGLLTEAIFVQMTKLRPSRSALEDPRAWWLYAAEAVRLMSHLGGESKGHSEAVSFSRKRRRPKGWLGVVRALRCRRRYIALYRKFLADSSTEEDMEECNARLLELEDELTTEEIVAYRMYLPSVLEDDKILKAAIGSPTTSKGRAEEAYKKGSGEATGISHETRKKAYDEMLIAISEVGWLLDFEGNNDVRYTGGAWRY